jgi:hypothetical protein
LVDQFHADFVCEAGRCSSFSPEPIQDDEEVAFILIDPLHYDEQRGVVVPAAFQELTNRDLSTLRVTHATRSEADSTRDELIQRGKDRIPPRLRLVNEVCVAAVAEIRGVVKDGVRLLGVYDTALEDVPAHASIFTRTDVLDSKKLRMIVRSQINEIFTKRRMSYETFAGMLKPDEAA